MLEQRYEIHFFERLQKRFEDIVTQCWSGFFFACRMEVYRP